MLYLELSKLFCTAVIWFTWRGALNSQELCESARSLGITSTDKTSTGFNTEHVTEENSLFHCVFFLKWMRGSFFVWFWGFFSSKWLLIYLRKNVWGREECCLGNKGRALPRRGCRGEWLKGSPNKNELGVCRVAIQISMLLCKSVAITVILFQNILRQLCMLNTCARVYTHRGIYCSPWISFGEGALNLDFTPQKNLPSHMNYNRHFKKGWQICFWMEVIHTHQKYQ